MKTVKKTKKKRVEFDPAAYAQKYRVIQVTLDSLDIKAEFEQLEARLKIDARKLSRAELLAEIDSASNMRWKAGNLRITAKTEHLRLEELFARKMGQWEVEARQELARLKATKSTNKIEGQVTQDLIRHHLTANNEEYRKLKQQLLVAGRNRAVLKNLYETWKGRQSLLQSIGRIISDSKTMPSQIIDKD